MPLPVSDLSSNAEENIAHAAKVIGRSKDRLKVFGAIYTGKQRIKTADEISKTTHLPQVRVLQEGKRLSDNHLVVPTKVDGRKAYEKIDFFHTHKKRILSLAASPPKLKAFPTKRNPAPRGSTDRIKLDVLIPRRKHSARMVTIDDIDSFAKAHVLSRDSGYTRMPERKFKMGMARILGEKGDFKDWGGENRDLSSTRVMIGGKRHSTAFAFKGPGKTGKLTPAKMGKNGDQIQRLFKCPAEVFLIQYWGQVDDMVLEQLESLAKLKSYMEDGTVWYGIIDGVDSTRLIQAYPKEFEHQFN
jgi:hypothetical protein